MNLKTALVYIFLFLLIILLPACRAMPDVNSQVTATSTAPASLPTPSEKIAATEVIIPTQTSTPLLSPSPQPQTGTIRGRLGYPSEVVPELLVVAFLYGTDTYYSIATEYNQTEYQLSDIPAGNYHIVAYTSGGDAFPQGLAGGYTQAVVCGMQETCSNHNLVDVMVIGGQAVENTDILDWLVPLPPMPVEGKTVMGAITGRLFYPSELIPPMKVVAYDVGSSTFYSVDTHERDTFYTLPVPSGVYQVVAYTLGGGSFPTGLAGGYTQAVPCGLNVSCEDHSLIEVNVSQGSVTAGVDPGDFYAPEGTFPPMP
jgi:hypothetical protein